MVREPALSAEQIVSFQENGFLVLDNLVPAEDLEAIEQEYDAALDEHAKRLYLQGDIADEYADLEFGARYARIISEYPDLHQFLNISLPLLNEDIDASTFHMHSGPAAFHLMRHPRILNVVEAIIGPEIYASPVQQMRMKPPEKQLSDALAGHSNVGATTWHQDIVALFPEADETEQLTVWLAISDASIESGCLVSIPGSHREGPKTHCSNDAIASEPQVPDKLMQGRAGVPLPVRKGGAVLFHKMNVHRALPNLSQNLRWSMDLRFHPIGQESGRPAFPGFVARSRSNPLQELHDAQAWAASWDSARERVLSGQHGGRIFEDRRWNDAAVC
ncbi:phytanoyl-CoA dioxygenase family protein [Labrenzia sp. 011]|uniref:phytanoyl-CoA dioxygenase family protein n=1 Tax=Labrenzia sp. 011 TaxID=2171494 RepID=UPI000D51AA1A|nr:phytanoyl-CoA dioxygenase family protein [Labrenzia sp. 011]PVB61472.1 phytanoyl-CoA dioxygenase [Labrenzia sp. 011]